MSNIYIQEPPALGKVLLKTTVGDIDLELWTKETPKACRNFIQLCMEGYYNGTIFHRVVRDFIVQGGDPKGDGTGGQSVYGAPFKDEFHTRLRFNRRGLVAMANSGKDDNESQFFFTLGPTPELQNKHTIFGKVTGETIYNMIKLAEGEIDHNEKPVYPHKIISCEVLINTFTDIVPRVVPKSKEQVPQVKKKKEKGVKNFGLLSFGMEAEEEDDQTNEFRGKPKSTHDLLDDPKLSKLTAPDINDELDDKSSDQQSDNEEQVKHTINNIRDKLSSENKKRIIASKMKDVDSEEEIEKYYLGKDKKEARKKQAEEIREQIRNLKREMSGKKTSTSSEKVVEVQEKPNRDNDMMREYESEHEKYKKAMEKVPKKGVSREEFTLSLLSKFQKKLSSAKEKYGEQSESKKEDTDDPTEDNWLAHQLRFDEKGGVLAKDASTKGDDWYDIYDPRNPLNKRKREKGKEDSNKHSKRH